MTLDKNLENQIIGAVREIGQDLSLKAVQPFEVEYKIGDDPVTQLDKETESQLIQTLSSLAPGLFSYIAEESGETKDNNSQYNVYIDPIDGTKSFSFQGFNSSTALGFQNKETNQNKIALGLVYDFMRDIMYVGSQNSGLNRFHKGILIPNLERERLNSKKRIVVEGNSNETLNLLKYLRQNGYSAYETSGSFALSMAHTGFQTYDGFISFPSEKVSDKPWETAAGAGIFEQRVKQDKNFTLTQFENSQDYNFSEPQTGFIASDNKTRQLLENYL